MSRPPNALNRFAVNGLMYPAFMCVVALPALAILSLGAGYGIWLRRPVGFRQSLSLQYGDYAPPHADVVLPQLRPDQTYEIALELDVPRSRANYELGNFMISIEIFSLINQTLVKSRMPHLLSPSISDYLPAFSPNIMDSSIKVIDSFVPKTSARVHAHIELGRRDNWQTIGAGRGQELTVRQAFLLARLKPVGSRALFASYLTSGWLFPIFAVFIFFVVSSSSLCIGIVFMAYGIKSSRIVTARKQ